MIAAARRLTNDNVCDFGLRRNNYSALCVGVLPELVERLFS